MPDQTFTIRTIAFASQEDAFLAIFNNETSDQRRLYKVNWISVKPAAPLMGSPFFSPITLRRITSLSGGEEINAIPHRIGHSLPSQVKIALRPQMTFSNGVLRQYHNVPFGQINTGSITALSYRTITSYLPLQCAMVGTGNLFLSGMHDSNIQPIVLRENQGIGMIESQTANLSPFPITTYLHVLLRDATNNRWFSVFEYIHSSPGCKCQFGIWNGSGSGIVLEVYKIDLTDVGDSFIASVTTNAPHIRFAKITGIRSGKDATDKVIPHNTADSIPSSLVVKETASVQMPANVRYTGENTGYGNPLDFGYPNTNVLAFRRVGAFHHRMTSIAHFAQPNLAMGMATPAFMNELYKSPPCGINYTGEQSGAIQPIVLRPQEGLAILQSNSSAYMQYSVEMNITHIPPPVSGGGKLPVGSVLFNVENGEPYIYIGDPLILKA